MSQPDESIRVLHVDDDPDFAELTRDMLKRESDRFEVDTATSAGEGMDRLSEGDYDCVVSDYEMPGRNGLDFLRSVREERPDLPFVLFTGKGSEEVASDAISASVSNYLQKGHGTEQYELLANRVTNTVERYRAERAVEETRRRFQTLVEEATDVTLIVSPDGTISFATPSAERILGRSPDELVGTDGFGLIHSDDRKRVMATFARLVEQPERRRTVEFRYEKPDGTSIWVEARGRNLLDDPVIGGIVVYARDTTERKERELELRRKERRFQAIFNDPNILVGLIDPDGTVLDINRTALEYVEASLDELTGTPFWETPWFDHSPMVQEEVQEWIDRAARGEYVEFEVDLRRPDGEPYTIQGVFRPVRDEDGEVVSLVISDREITERRERERELERVRELLAEAERLGNLGAWEFDETGDVVWTDGTRRIFDVDDAFEPTLENGVEFFHPDDRSTIEGAISRALEAGEPFDEQARLVTAEGRERWVRTRGEPLDGEAATVRGYVQDITERKQAEQERERIIGRVTDAIVEVDADWQFTLVNEQAEELYDMTEADLLGRDFWDVFSDAHGTRFEEEYRGVMETREPTSFDEYFSGLDGWFDIQVYPNDDGGLSFYFREVTELKGRERKLARQRALLEAQKESVLDGQLVVDETGEVISYNDRFVELWELPEEFVARGDDAAVLDYVADRLARPREFREKIEYLYDHVDETSRDEIELEDGRVFDRYTAPLLAGDGTHYGRLWTFRDITERIERESELKRQNERLEAFASIVSHDLRNPLNVAQGRLEMAREECDSDHLEATRRAHDRTFALIDDLLTLARGEGTAADHEPVRLADVVESCWRNVETLDATLVPATERTIRTDRSRLKQLLENLFRNAVEHGGADVTVRVGDLDDGFYVEDDGSGIPPHARDQVFQSGYSTLPEGTGFGLSIVEQTVAAQGWRIDATDGTDGGARFEITGVDVD